MVMIQCPHCQWAVPYVEEFAGREVFCLGCGRHFVLPSQAPATPASDGSEAVKPLVIKLKTQKDSAQPPAAETADGQSSNPKRSE